MSDVVIKQEFQSHTVEQHGQAGGPDLKATHKLEIIFNRHVDQINEHAYAIDEMIRHIGNLFAGDLEHLMQTTTIWVSEQVNDDERVSTNVVDTVLHDIRMCSNKMEKAVAQLRTALDEIKEGVIIFKNAYAKQSRTLV